MKNMRRTKAEKLLTDYYREINHEKKGGGTAECIEKVMKIALIINFALLLFVPQANRTKLDLSLSEKAYKEDLMHICENLTIYGEEKK